MCLEAQRKGMVITMKRIVCILLALGLTLSLCACGSSTAPQQGSTSQAPTEGETASATEQQVSESNDSVENFFGYHYEFPSEKTSKKASNGAIFTCDGCDIYAYKNDDISFVSWDTIKDDCEAKMFDAVHAAFKIRPENQVLETGVQTNNVNGVELLRLEGVLELEFRRKPRCKFKGNVLVRISTATITA